MLYFALMQTGLGPSTMAKKAYVNLGFLQVQRGTILLSFSSFAGVMAAQHYYYISISPFLLLLFYLLLFIYYYHYGSKTIYRHSMTDVHMATPIPYKKSGDM